MIRIAQSALGCGPDAALDAHLYTRIAAAPGQLPGAPLPSVVGPAAVRGFARAYPWRVVALAAWRAHRRLGAQRAKAALN